MKLILFQIYILQFVFVCVLSSSYGRPQLGYTYTVPTLRQANFLGASSINYPQHQLAPFPNHLVPPQTPFAGNFIDQHAHHNGGLFGSSSNTVNTFSGNHAFGATPTLVHKHIYVHVPPPDPEDELRTAQSQLAPTVIPQKHYKIIFIKAPSNPAPPVQQQQQLALAAQNQEKTIVYVLVKKPEQDTNELAAASSPIGVTAPSSKPEVYFIKYKTQKDNFGSTAESSNQLNTVSSFGSLNTVIPLPGSSSAKAIEKRKCI